MLVRQLSLPEVLEIVPTKHGDDRGFFSETYNAGRFKEAGINLPWVQDNHSFSAPVGVVRGLHFQKPPFAQDKLVRVVKGAIIDIAVDISGSGAASSYRRRNGTKSSCPKGLPTAS